MTMIHGQDGRSCGKAGLLREGYLGDYGSTRCNARYLYVGNLVAREMLTTPGFEGAVFTNATHNFKMINAVHKALGVGVFPDEGTLKAPPHLGSVEFRVTGWGQQFIHIRVDGDRRTLCVYDVDKRDQRGVGGNYVLVDEARNVSNLFFRENIVPLLALVKTRFVALSTTSSRYTADWFDKAANSEFDYLCGDCTANWVRTDACLKIKMINS